MCVLLEEEHSSFRLLKREKMKALLKLLNDRRRRRITRARDDTLKKKKKNRGGEFFFCDERRLHARRGFLKFFERREIEKSQGEGDSAHSTKWGSPSQTRKRQENAIWKLMNFENTLLYTT